MLQRLLPITLALVLALVPAATASPRAHSAAQQAEVALEQVEDLLDGRGVRTGRELTEALRELSTRLRHLRGAARARAAAILDRPDEGPADLCSANFCITGSPLGVLTAPLVLAEAEAVHAFQVGQLGWREPPDDGDGRVDIYLEDLGAEQLFGYAQTDGGSTQSQSSFLALDDDFDPSQYGGADPLESLRLTLAHEYAHVLQYGYDVLADSWHYESSAVWMEQRTFPAIKDWLRFLIDSPRGPGWRSLTELPLTAFDHPSDPRSAKPYGSAVWNQFLTSNYGAGGDALQRGSWEHSNGLDAPSTDAYGAAIRAAGGRGMSSEFALFAAAVAEWQAGSSPFPARSEFPDVERHGSLATDGAGVAPVMDHLTFAFYDVPPTDAPQIRLAALFPAGMSGALALVARSGSPSGGEVTSRFLELPAGGAGGITLEQPGSFFDSGGRITAVLVNADITQSGYSHPSGDWRWSRDGQRVAASIASDTGGPAVSARSPGPGARGVSPRSHISVSFSEPVAGVDEKTFVLRDPRGRRVPAAVAYVNATRTATLTPARPLADTTRYTVRVGGTILSASARPLAQTDWTFKTKRVRPRASLSLRGGRPRLRSRDRDRLLWSATLRQDGRTVGRRSGAIRPGRTRNLRITGGRAGRARLVVVLTDPQGNRRRIARALRLLP